MIRRRGILFMIGAWILGGVWVIVSGLPLGRFPFWLRRASAEDVAAGTAQAKQLGEKLITELARLETRDYSREGIPMLLACENLVPDGTSEVAAAAPLASNLELAATFRQYAASLPEVRNDLTEGDVAKLVELLAMQDFAASGKEFHK